MTTNIEKNLNKIPAVALALAGLAVFIPAGSIWAGNNNDTEGISWMMLFLGITGGLAFFLYGMELMSEGLKKTAGNKMRSILAALTKNRFIGLLMGAFVTTVIQSSSATTVMLVSFVQAELMTFAQSLGVILGADIGTTITAQLVAFKMTDYALAMIAIGFGVRMFGRSEKIKSIGDIMLGFGILFYGMKLMSDSMKPLRTYPQFIDMMKSMDNPLLGILAGTVFTALVQGSGATTGVVIVLAQQGLISLEGGIAVTLGANIGTCVTALLACIGTRREAKRVAVAHVLFKVVGVLLIVPFLGSFADMIRSLAALFDSGTARQIANAHTVFNVGIALCFLPFIDLFAHAILRLMPDKPRERGIEPAARHLEDSLVSTPAIALELAHAEIARMAKILGRMHNAAILPFITANDQLPRDEIHPEQLDLLQGIAMREQKINFLEEKIRQYLLKISRQQLAEGQASEVNALLSLLDSMESIGDIIIRQMVPLAKKKGQLDADFSEEGRQELISYHKKIGKQLNRLEQMMVASDSILARKVRKKKKRYDRLSQRLRHHHLRRLLDMKEQSVDTHEIHLELLDALNQINGFSADIAKSLIKGGIQDRPSERQDKDQPAEGENTPGEEPSQQSAS
ncbi:MAG: Na/Pi cotransporter family protein [Candidatus Electrothrix sp. AX5]|nr:Na/Pi cotransporter family protein [Candidatus Electrothrix sp. AX5]